MKTFLQKLGLAVGLALAFAASPVRAQDGTAGPAPAPGDSSVSFQTFYDQLASQGSWIQTNQYGYVFQPTESNPDWRPYTYGHWVNTDAGMTWVSDDSFGWATDHYGRWVNLAGTGWVWVPGYTWGPAWVSWREGADDVGWAPLPPDSDVGIDYYGDNSFDFGLGFFGFHIGDDCDTAYGIGPWCYNFCPIAYIGDPDCWHHFRDRGDNFAYIGNTRNVTNINYNRDGAGRFGRVRAEGPSVAALNARAHTPIQTVTLADASRRDAAGLHGHTLAVYAPRVDPKSMASARPASVSQHLANATVNRGTSINRPLAVNSRLSPAAPTATQVHAAALAQGRYSSGARIATAHTRISHPLSQPLTSLRTEARSGATATNDNTRFTGNAAQPEHPGTAAVAPESRYSGGESSFTGEPAERHATASSPGERSFTGEPAERHATPSSTADRSFTGEPATASHQAPAVHHTPSYAANSAPAYHPQAAAPVYHPSASVYHPQAGTQVFHQSAPAYHPQASAPAFHHSEPAYHPQASFHSAAPASHFGGGGFHGGGGATAAHAGGGGGHPSGGGAHASAGNNKH